MLLKPRKSKRFLVPAVLLLVVLASAGTIKRNDIAQSAWETWEAFLINDPGISSRNQLGSSPKELAANLVRLAPKIVWFKLSGFDDRPPIERLDIDLKFVDYKRILADRDNALQEGILHSPTEVKAKLRYQGDTFKAKVRLKGDLIGHWSTRTRLSFRVKKSGDGTILGFKKFSLHRPRARIHPYDAAFQAFVRRLGVLAPEHKFLRVYVNGENWGIMDVEEHMAKELLERQGAKESLIIRFGNQESWLYRRQFPEQRAFSEIYRLSSPDLNYSVAGAKKMLAPEINRERLSYLLGVRDSDNPQNVYDIDAYAAAWVAAQIWNDPHTLDHSNSRNYFNPYTLMMEPLTTDEGPIQALNDSGDCGHFIEIAQDYDGYKNLVHSSSFRESVVKQYDRAASVLPDVMNDFEYYQQFFPLDPKVDSGQLKRNLEIIRAAPDMCLPSLQPIASQPIDLNLAKNIDAESLPQHIYSRHYINGDLEVYNLLPDAIQIKTVLVNGNPLPEFSQIAVPSYLDENKPLTISTELDGVRDGSLQIVSEYQGVVRQADVTSTLYPDDQLHNPLQATAQKLPDFIQASDSGGWIIDSGAWEVTEPVVLDGPLQIMPGAQVSFGSDAYLIIKGHLDAVGREDARIVLRPSLTHWKGLYVFRAGQPSHMKYVDIVNTSGVADGLLALTGGVNFYQSDIYIRNSTINGTIAEDALNVVKSKFLLDSSFVGNTPSDAFDGDFSEGTISNSEFRDVGGDAIDFSGSQIAVVDTDISNVRDKAVSVGEASFVDVQGGTIENVGVGIASKDGSKATISSVRFGDASVFTLMSYMKKDFYGSPDLNATNNAFPGNARFARQAGSGMTIDGESVDEQDLDVESLYATGGVMAK